MRLSHVLNIAGVRPQAKYVVYFSIDPKWWDSLDIDEAVHPQTFLAYGMNGKDLPVGNGGPLRMRVPRHPCNFIPQGVPRGLAKSNGSCTAKHGSISEILGDFTIEGR